MVAARQNSARLPPVHRLFTPPVKLLDPPWARSSRHLTDCEPDRQFGVRASPPTRPAPAWGRLGPAPPGAGLPRLEKLCDVANPFLAVPADASRPPGEGGGRLRRRSPAGWGPPS